MRQFKSTISSKWKTKVPEEVIKILNLKLPAKIKWVNKKPGHISIISVVEKPQKRNF